MTATSLFRRLFRHVQPIGPCTPAAAITNPVLSMNPDPNEALRVPAPRHAGDAVNEEIRDLEYGTTDYQCETLRPIFRLLVAEARKRGLPAADDEKRAQDESVRARNMDRVNRLAAAALSEELAEKEKTL